MQPSAFTVAESSQVQPSAFLLNHCTVTYRPLLTYSLAWFTPSLQMETAENCSWLYFPPCNPFTNSAGNKARAVSTSNAGLCLRSNHWIQILNMIFGVIFESESLQQTKIRKSRLSCLIPRKKKKKHRSSNMCNSNTAAARDII